MEIEIRSKVRGDNWGNYGQPKLSPLTLEGFHDFSFHRRFMEIDIRSKVRGDNWENDARQKLSPLTLEGFHEFSFHIRLMKIEIRSSKVRGTIGETMVIQNYPPNLRGIPRFFIPQTFDEH